MTVVVSNEEEGGVMTWTVDADGDGDSTIDNITDQVRSDLLEFQADSILKAEVTDPDGPNTIDEAATTNWSWYRSRNKTGPWTEIVDDDGDPVSTNDTYTVSDDADSDDIGMYLRVVAKYTDSLGDDEASFVSAHRVREAKVADNSLPEFAPTTHRRSVTEEVAGDVAGGVVTATDADNHVLNYTLVTDGGDPITGAYPFAINQATGQITTTGPLDYETVIAPNTDWVEMTDEQTGIISRTFTITVRATDSAGGETGGADNIDATVTITLRNVNEAPDFVDTTANQTLPQNTEGMVADRSEEGVGIPWTLPYEASVTTYGISVYTVDDPEGVDIDEGKWSLEGDDAAKFQLTGTTDNTRTLEFADKPDFEMPGDKNTDNIYEVTVVASDGGEAARRDVIVKITDSDEAGVIELSNVNPVTGQPVTATLTDSDGDVINVGWKWYALDDRDQATIDAITDVDAPTPPIKGATSNTYRPGTGDIGKHLVAVANYMDRTEDEDNTPQTTVDEIAAFIRFANRAQSDLSAPVIDDPANAAPEFVEGATAVRYVEEDDDSDRPNRTPETIGAPVTAEDDDNPTLDYSLSGTDAASFRITAGTGQLMTRDPLDFETKDTYTVVVTARDGSGGTDLIDVTIEVKDRDEWPTLSASAGGLAISGRSSVPYAENGTSMVETYSADGATLSLVGTDASDFNLSGGVLSFRNIPNFEAPADADGDNTYMVTVVATDGSRTAERAVTVSVTDVDELGGLSGNLSHSYEEGGVGAVGTYAASGGSMSDVANWSLMGDDAADFDISTSGILSFVATPDFETPVDEDGDNTYMVTVKAEAGGEMDMVDVTVMVTNEDEDGTVTLMPASPVVGIELSAELSDDDGGITGATWQWAIADAMDGPFADISRENSASYTPVEGDVGKFLRVSVSYTDVLGTGKTAMTTTSVVAATAADSLLVKYDGSDNGGNDNGKIDIEEISKAFTDYIGGRISIHEMSEIFTLYIQNIQAG